MAILRERGPEAVAIRTLAARANVSHAAPAHHFGNAAGLFSAVAARGFEAFARELARWRSEAAADARSQLSAACDGYVHFATSEPALFRFIFSLAGHQFDWTAPELAEASASAVQHLRDVAGLVAAARGSGAMEDPEDLEGLIWSTVHGYCQLLSAGRLSGSPRRSGEPPPRPKIEELLFPVNPSR
jgi:AcrR family transcriptional regulator